MYPEAEDYGLLVAYDEYSRTYHVDGDRYVTVIGNDAATYIDENGKLRQVDNTLVENSVSAFSMFDSGAVFYVNNANYYIQCGKCTVRDTARPAHHKLHL